MLYFIVSCSPSKNIAVLHPFSIVVYGVNCIAGSTDHGKTVTRMILLHVKYIITIRTYYLNIIFKELKIEFPRYRM